MIIHFTALKPSRLWFDRSTHHEQLQQHQQKKHGFCDRCRVTFGDSRPVRDLLREPMPRSLHPEGRSDTLQDILGARKGELQWSHTRRKHSPLTVENHLMRRSVCYAPTRILCPATRLRDDLFENSGKTSSLSNKRLLSIQLFQTATIHHRTFVIVHNEACWICQQR